MPNLNLPTPGVTPGPEWASRVNVAFDLLNDAVEGTDSSSFLSVYSTGAKGDGTTDDTEAIQAAFDDAFTTRNGVYFPPGDYRVSSNLNLPRGVYVYGAGMNSSVIRGTGSLKLNIKGGSQGVGADWGGPQLRDMTLHGIGVIFGETSTDWGNGASLQNVEIRYTPVGLTLRYNTFGFRGTNLRIHQCSTAGILHDFAPVTAGSGSNISYIDCMVFNCGANGFSQNGVAIDGGHTSFVNTDIENCGVSYNIIDAAQTVFELTNGHYELNNTAYIRANSGLIWISGCWMFDLRESSTTKVALFDLSGTARVHVMSGRISWSTSSRLLRNTSSSTRALVIDTENVILPQVGMDITVPGDPATSDSTNGLAMKPGRSRSSDTQVSVPTAGVPVRVLSTHPFDRTTYECSWATVLSGTTTGVNMLIHVRPATGGVTFTVPMQSGATLVKVNLKMSLTEAVVEANFNNGHTFVGRSPLTHTPASTRYVEMALGNSVTGVVVSREVISRGV